MQRQFITAGEIAEIAGVSKGTGYKIIRELNAELKKMGYITITGKVPRTFFEEKAYGVRVGEMDE